MQSETSFDLSSPGRTTSPRRSSGFTPLPVSWPKQRWLPHHILQRARGWIAVGGVSAFSCLPLGSTPFRCHPTPIKQTSLGRGGAPVCQQGADRSSDVSHLLPRPKFAQMKLESEEVLQQEVKVKPGDRATNSPALNRKSACRKTWQEETRSGNREAST